MDLAGRIWNREPYPIFRRLLQQLQVGVKAVKLASWQLIA